MTALFILLSFFNFSEANEDSFRYLHRLHIAPYGYFEMSGQFSPSTTTRPSQINISEKDGNRVSTYAWERLNASGRKLITIETASEGNRLHKFTPQTIISGIVKVDNGEVTPNYWGISNFDEKKKIVSHTQCGSSIYPKCRTVTPILCQKLDELIGDTDLSECVNFANRVLGFGHDPHWEEVIRIEEKNLEMAKTYLAPDATRLNIKSNSKNFKSSNFSNAMNSRFFFYRLLEATKSL